MSDEKWYELWDRVIDFALVLSGFVIAVLIFMGIPK